MSELKISKGKIDIGKIKHATVKGDDYVIAIVSPDDDERAYTLSTSSQPSGVDQGCQNAEFIRDCFVVANETGKTPRQLLEQRNDLLAAIKGLKELYQLEGAPKEGGHGPYKPGSLEWQRECRKRYEAAAEAIADAEGRP